jgi:hypothetical protein
MNREHYPGCIDGVCTYLPADHFGRLCNSCKLCKKDDFSDIEVINETDNDGIDY